MTSGVFYELQKFTIKYWAKILKKRALSSLAVCLRTCCGYAATVKMAKKQRFQGEFAVFDGLTDWESFANPGLAYKMA